MISKDELKRLWNTQIGRIETINLTHDIPYMNFQHNRTPMSLVRDMCDRTFLFDKNILVMFNLEFLEHLVFECGVPVGNITFVADTEMEKVICNKLYGCYSIIVNEIHFRCGYLTKELKAMSKHFDLCFSNPPYNRNVDLKIISELEPLCDEMVVVHPSTWAIDMKGKSKLYNTFKTQIEGKVKSLEFFNGNPVFKIGLFVPCMITHIDKNHSGDIRVKYFNDEFAIENLDGVTKFGKDWETIVKPFYLKIKKYVQENGSIWDKNVFEVKEGKHYCQLAAIRGNVDMAGDGSKIVKDDFYTMLMENSEGNKGIREPRLHKPGGATPTFSFATEIERNNFIDYLKTDFSRFCLSILKIGQHLENGELSIIPWLDFSQEWDDEKLFHHFDVDKQTQDYIRQFLPDFHGIRK